MEKPLYIYKDLNSLRSPTLPDSVHFVLNSQTQKVFQIWVTDNQNVPKQVDLGSPRANTLISGESGNILRVGLDGKLFVPPSATLTGEFIKIAGENISSGMAVVIETDGLVYRYDIFNYNHAGLSCGIAKTSGIFTETITLKIVGNILTEVGSGWLAGKSYFVGVNSLLTVSAPLIGVVKKIGTGIANDTIIIENYTEHILI